MKTESVSKVKVIKLRLSPLLYCFLLFSVIFLLFINAKPIYGTPQGSPSSHTDIKPSVTVKKLPDGRIHLSVSSADKLEVVKSLSTAFNLEFYLIDFLPKGEMSFEKDFETVEDALMSVIENNFVLEYKGLKPAKIYLLKEGGEDSTKGVAVFGDRELIMSKIFTRVDRDLILSTINKHKDAVPIKTAYTVFRTEIKGTTVLESIEYTLELDEPIDHITITKGNPRSNALSSLRYHNMIKTLEESMGKGNLNKDIYGQYRLTTPDAPFNVILKINPDKQIVTEYGLYKDKDLIIRATLQTDLTFSKIEVNFYDSMSGNTISETYIRN